MTNEERKAALEAIIYAADEPATIEQLAGALGEEKLVVQAALDELVAAHAAEDRGIEIRAVAGGYKTYTKPQHHDVVRRFIKSLRPPLRLTMPALETLAVISYKQPVTVPEISEIRGVTQGGDGPANPIQDFKRIFDALWAERFVGAAELEGIRGAGPRSAGQR
jgi:segregation and condensation protein B